MKARIIDVTYTTAFYFIYFIYFFFNVDIYRTNTFYNKNSNKMLIEVNTLVKKPIEHKTFYKKKYSPTKILIYNITVK